MTAMRSRCASIQRGNHHREKKQPRTRTSAGPRHGPTLCHASAGRIQASADTACAAARRNANTSEAGALQREHRRLTVRTELRADLLGHYCLRLRLYPDDRARIESCPCAETGRALAHYCLQARRDGGRGASWEVRVGLIRDGAARRGCAQAAAACAPPLTAALGAPGERLHARGRVGRGVSDEPVELVEQLLEVRDALGARIEQRVHHKHRQLRPINVAVEPA
eukprot:2934483-Pleurochrysis_carterae.AAC.2